MAESPLGITKKDNTHCLHTDFHSFLPDKTVSAVKWENNEISSCSLEIWEIWTVSNTRHGSHLKLPGFKQMSKMETWVFSSCQFTTFLFFLTSQRSLYAKDGSHLSCYLHPRSETQGPCFLRCVLPTGGSKYNQEKHSNQLPDPLLNSKIFLLIISSFWAEHVFIETSHDVLFNLIHYLLNSFWRHWNIQKDIWMKDEHLKWRVIFS